MDDIEQDTLNMLFIMLIGIVALMATIKVNIASLAVAGTALLFYLFGWMTASGYVISLAVVIAILDMILKTKK